MTHDSDIWSHDDPALTRAREALAARLAVPAPERISAPELMPATIPEDTQADLTALTARLRDGDLSVRERLARLLDRLRQDSAAER
jgi:hypothetical protein